MKKANKIKNLTSFEQFYFIVSVYFYFTKSKSKKHSCDKTAKYFKVKVFYKKFNSTC